VTGDPTLSIIATTSCSATVLPGEWQRENALGDLDHFVGAIKAMQPQWRLDDVASVAPATPSQPSGNTVHYETGYVLEGR
jgi:hypothetical protein